MDHYKILLNGECYADHFTVGNKYEAFEEWLSSNGYEVEDIWERSNGNVYTEVSKDVFEMVV